MSRTRGVGALVAVALMGVAGPATAEFTSATFGPTGTLTAHGRVATLSLRVACTDGQVRFTATLNQGSVSAVGRGAVRCSRSDDDGSLVQDCVLPLDEPENGAPLLTHGRAEACGQVIFQQPGGDEQSYRWCSEVLLQPSERP